MKTKLLAFLALSIISLNLLIAAEDGTSCEDAYSIEGQFSTVYNFPEESEMLYFTYNTEEDSLALDFTQASSPLEIYQVDVYNIEDCNGLSFLYSLTASDSSENNYFDWFNINVGYNYLLVLHRNSIDGFNDVNFTFSIGHKSIIHCPVDYNLSCGELILNQGFDFFKTTNINRRFAFGSSEVCRWGVAFQSPEITLNGTNDYRAKLWSKSDDGEGIKQKVSIQQGDYLLSIMTEQFATQPKPTELKIDFAKTSLVGQPIISSSYYSASSGKQNAITLTTSQIPNSGTNSIQTFCISANDDYDYIVIYPKGSSTTQSWIVVDDISLINQNDINAGENLYYSCPKTIGPTCVIPGATYAWSPTTGLDNSTIPNPTVWNPNSQVYNLTITLPNNACTITDQVTTNFTGYNFSSSEDITFCKRSVTLGPDCVHPGATYSWSPATGLSATNIANPIASPTATTTYTCTVTVPGSPPSVFTYSTVVNFSNSSSFSIDYHAPDGTTAGDLIAALGTSCPGQPCINFKNILIEGTLYLNSDVTFYLCHFYMGENSKIIIDNASVYFNGSSGYNSAIKSCNPDEYWDGIYVDGNLNPAFGIFQVPEFSGSKNGIIFKNGAAPYRIHDVDFINNFRCITFQDYASPYNWNGSIIGYVNEEITGNTFQCTQPLEDENLGLIYPEYAVYFKNVEEYTSSSFGPYKINFTNTGGHPSTGNSGVNVFYGSGGGFYVENSDINIDNCVFQGFNNLYIPAGVGSKQETAIRIIGSSTNDREVELINNRFYSNVRSIENFGKSQLQIEDNMVNVDHLGNVYSSLTGSSFVRVFDNTASGNNIYSNTVYNVKEGIVANNFYPSLIYNNIFDMEVQASSSSYNSKNNSESVAIYMDNSNLDQLMQQSVTSPMIISGNSIQHSKIGIQAQFGEAYISGNTITDMNDQTNTNCFPFPGPCPVVPAYGIRALNDIFVIEENEISNDNSSGFYSPSPSGNTDIIGISLENSTSINSTSSTVNCNKVENTGIGLRFMGVSEIDTDVEKNTLQEHYFGFVLKNGGKIGNVGTSQYASDNEWIGPFNSSGSHTYADNSDGRLCTLNVQNSTTYNPSIVNSNQINGFAIQKNSNVPNPSLFGCSAPLLSKKPNKPILKPNQLKSNASSIHRRNVVKGNSKSYFFVPDSMLVLNQQMLFKQMLFDTTLINDAVIQNFMDSMKTTANGRVLGKVTNPRRSSTMNHFEENLVTISEVIAKLENSLPLNLSDSIAIYSIAKKCPYYDGIAVYEARTLLLKLGLPMVSNPCESIISKSQGPKRIKSDETVVPFNLYPNPTSNNITIEFEPIEKSFVLLEFYDLLGKKITTKQLSNQSTQQVNISYMKPGMYIYRLKVNGTPTESGRLIIQ